MGSREETEKLWRISVAHQTPSPTNVRKEMDKVSQDPWPAGSDWSREAEADATGQVEARALSFEPIPTKLEPADLTSFPSSFRLTAI